MTVATSELPPRRYSASLLVLTLLVSACARSESEPPPSNPPQPELVGAWRAVLTSPGGELPFGLEISAGGDGLEAAMLNDDERAPFSSVTVNGKLLVLEAEWYDSTITAELDASGDTLRGSWQRTAAGDTVSRLPFEANRGKDHRFQPLHEVGLERSEAKTLPSVAGVWEVAFADEDGTEPARGEFRQQGGEVRGTFLTPTGDYRYLEGSYEAGVLRLSTFDGAHAFLFQARAQEDGSLAGDFWSRDSYHATWTARRVAAETTVLPDAWREVSLSNDEGRFRFAFEDLDGQAVSIEDERFDDKVLLVNIFGSWCPNCNDEAPLLAEWARRYRERGLEVVGIAYEFTGNLERDRRQVRRFAERHGVDYTLLLGGISDKDAAGETLSDLTALLSYPTSVFIGRDGRVARIYSGFSGPGTGEHHTKLVAEMEAIIEGLLADA